MLPIAPILLIAARLAMAAARSGKSGGTPAGRNKRPAPLPGIGVGDLVRVVTWVVCLAGWNEASDDLASTAPELLPAYLLSIWVLPALTLFAGVVSVPSLAGPVLARHLPPALAWFPLRLIAPYGVRGQDHAWAALVILDHARRPMGEADVVRLEQGLLVGAPPLPLTIVARAALAEARGDDLRARDLLTAVHRLPPLPGLILARRYARRWLVVRAATRGNWDGVDEISQAPHNDAAVRSVIQRVRALRGGRVPSRWERLVDTVLHGHGRFIHAVAAPPPVTVSHAPTLPPADASALVRALWWQRKCSLAWASPEDFLAAGAAWDALPHDTALRDALTRRAETLGLRIPADPDAPPDAPAPDPAMTVLSEVWRTAVHQLVGLCLGRHGLPPATGQTLTTVRRWAGEALYKELDVQLATLDEPARADVQRDVVEGWLRYQRVRSIADGLAAGAPDAERAMVFEVVRVPVLDFAVWAYNVQGHRILGHCIMLWLVELGAGVGPPAVLQTLKSNLALGY